MIPLIYHPIYSQLDLPPEHRYPINKYRLLYDAVLTHQSQDQQWLTTFKFFQPQALTANRVKQIHSADYVDQLVSGTLAAAKMR